MVDYRTNYPTLLFEAPDRQSTQLMPVPEMTVFTAGDPVVGTNGVDIFLKTTIAGKTGYLLKLRASDIPTAPDAILPEEFAAFRNLVTRTAEVHSADPVYLMAFAYAGTANLTKLGGPGDGPAGPFQFTAAQWNAAITTGPAGNVAPQVLPEDRFSWRSQPEVAALVAADRVQQLQSPAALGRLPTRVELYFAQLFGPGAELMLKRPPATICKDAMQGVVASGPYATGLAASGQSIGAELATLRTRLATGLVATGMVDGAPDDVAKNVDAASAAANAQHAAGPNAAAPGVALGALAIGGVDYTKYAGGGDIDSWIAQACVAAGLPQNDAWVRGYKTLCLRESSDRPNAINTTDGNADGTIVRDGYPQGCSRGVAQCVPGTFAAYHASGTSVSIYDPVANIAASMLYVRKKYHVSLDGSDFAATVQQADPKRPPKGY